MYLRGHPAPGVGCYTDDMAPGVTSLSGFRRPHIGELMPGHFTIPENPLVRSICKVNGILLPEHGAGRAGMGGLGFFAPASTGMGILGLEWSGEASTGLKWALYGIGAMAVVAMFTGKKRRGKGWSLWGGSGGGGKKRVTVKEVAAPAPPQAPAS